MLSDLALVWLRADGRPRSVIIARNMRISLQGVGRASHDMKKR